MSDRFRISGDDDVKDEIHQIESGIEYGLKEAIKWHAGDGFTDELAEAVYRTCQFDILKVRKSQDPTGKDGISFILELRLPDEIPSEPLMPLLEKTFGSKGYAEFIIGENPTVKLSDLQEYPEFKEGYQQEADWGGISMIHVALLTPPEVRIPIANAMGYAERDAAELNIDPYLISDKIKNLENPDYWKLPTKYFVWGVEKASGEQKNYELVKKCMEEYNEILKELSLQIKSAN